MTKRITYLLAVFSVLLGNFVLQKPLFMLYNHTFSKDCGVSDYLLVMLHGLKLDSTIAAYLLIIPWLVVLVSVWLPKINLRKILPVYYGLIAFLIALAFVADTSLYAFWNFKLDATVLFYMDSPSNMAASISVGFIVVRVLALVVWAIALYWVLMRVTFPCHCGLDPQSPDNGGNLCKQGIAGQARNDSFFLPTKNRCLGAVLMILLGGLLFLCIRGGITESTSNIGRAYFSDNQFLNHSAVNPNASFFYSVGTPENYAEQFDFLPEADRAATFENLYPKGGETAVHLLNTDRPNVLIILWDGLGGNFI
jgi:hypothetical protein